MAQKYQSITEKKAEAKSQISEYEQAANILQDLPFGEINSWEELLAYQVMSSYSYHFSIKSKDGDDIYGIKDEQKPLYLAQAQKYAKVVINFFFEQLYKPPHLKWFRIAKNKCSGETLQKLQNNFRQAFDIRARMYDLDCYAVAIEWNRPIDEQFYLPRRKCFKNLETIDGEMVDLVQDGQDLIDGKLDFLFNALPQRCGKSMLRLTILSLMAIKEVMHGRNRSIFTLSHSAGLARHFYNSTLRFFNDTRTYRTLEIFPEISVFFKSNEYREITLNKEQTYPTFADKSIDGDVTGSTEASLCASADDLIKDHGEVLNPDVADKILDKANTYIFGRKKKGVPVYGNATLWGELCPFTRIIEAYKEIKDERVKINLFSCYNSKGESQFDYEYNLGFDTAHFKEIERRMARTNYALWSALYLAKPVPVEGRLFDNVLYFRQSELDELKKKRKLYVCMPVDVAVKKKGDYLSAPIMEVDEVEKIVYITDIVHSNDGTDYTIPKLAEKIIKYRVERAEFEEKEGSNKANKIDYGIKAEVKKIVTALGYINCNMNNHTGAGLASKGNRIDQYANEIAGIRVPNGYIVKFLDAEDRQTHKEYNLAMEHLFAYSQSPKKQGKQKDDFPDVISQGFSFLIKDSKNTVEIYSMKKLLPL